MAHGPQDHDMSGRLAFIESAAALLDLAIPAECMPGVAANLGIIKDHVDRLLGSGPDDALPLDKR